AIDLQLTNPEREQNAGSFNVDLVAEDPSGDAVVIENQLGKTDHDHLGKLLTYMVSREAKTAVWVAADPRPEHVKTVAWLNESTDASFFLMKIEAITIGDSEPAPLLTLVVGPSDEARAVGTAKKELAERHIVRQRFWTQLLQKARARSTLHAAISPSQSSWVSTGAGMSGLSYNYVIRRHEAAVELYIDRGKGSDEENRRILESLRQHKADIEQAFGEALEWDWAEGRRACRVRFTIEKRGYADADGWDELQDIMVDAMTRLAAGLSPFLEEVRR
ncbi:MAG: DUF4268 domain-containing protein, partial [Armatimonadetes bacterium]|nr:DUF4268 domain-containing protein [Armatimonadota bacterium]